MGGLAINALAQKQIVIDIIVNALDQDYIVLIVIAKIARISHQKIGHLIEILLLSQINQKQNWLLALVQKVDAIKNTANVTKMGANVILYVGVQRVKTVKMEKNQNECCLANSIYIIKNKIIEEDIDEGNLTSDKNNKNLLKKRKRTISAQN